MPTQRYRGMRWQPPAIRPGQGCPRSPRHRGTPGSPAPWRHRRQRRTRCRNRSHRPVASRCRRRRHRWRHPGPRAQAHPWRRDSLPGDGHRTRPVGADQTCRERVTMRSTTTSSSAAGSATAAIGRQAMSSVSVAVNFISRRANGEARPGRHRPFAPVRARRQGQAGMASACAVPTRLVSGTARVAHDAVTPTAPADGCARVAGS